MKKLFICVIALLWIRCFTSLVFLKYDVPMVEVDRPADVKEKYGDIETITLMEGNKYFYSDSLIDATFVFLLDAIGFVIVNKSEHTMRLLWDDACLIEPDNTSTRVMHAGVKYTDRNSSMPPSIIPRRGKLEDQAVPTNRIYYRKGYYSQYGSTPGGWENSGIFPWHTTITGGSDEEAKLFHEKGKKNIGSRIGLLLPLQIQDIKNDYTFWFKVRDVALDESSSK